MSCSARSHYTRHGNIHVYAQRLGVPEASLLHMASPGYTAVASVRHHKAILPRSAGRYVHMYAQVWLLVVGNCIVNTIHFVLRTAMKVMRYM